MGTEVKLDPSSLRIAAYQFGTVARSIVSAVEAAQSQLSGTHGMAGGGETGEAFADGEDGYDALARAILPAPLYVANRLYTIEAALTDTANLYGEAQKPGAMVAPSFSPASADSTGTSASVPSAYSPEDFGMFDMGKFREGLEWALQQLGISQLPSGDEGKLGDAQSAWTGLQSALTSAKSTLDGISPLAGIVIPQEGDVEASIRALATDLGELAAGAGAMEDMVAQHKLELTTAKQQIQDFIEQMAIEIAAEIGFTILLSIITGGLGAFLGAAKAMATAMKWAHRIKNAIDKLQNALRALRHGGGRVGAMARRVAKETASGYASGAAGAAYSNWRHSGDAGYQRQDVSDAGFSAAVGGAVAAPLSRVLGGSSAASGAAARARRVAADKASEAGSSVASDYASAKLSGKEYTLNDALNSARQGLAESILVDPIMGPLTGAGDRAATAIDRRGDQIAGGFGNQTGGTPSGTGAPSSTSPATGGTTPSNPDNVPTPASSGPGSSTPSGGGGNSTPSNDAPNPAGAGGDGGANATGGGSTDAPSDAPQASDPLPQDDAGGGDTPPSQDQAPVDQAPVDQAPVDQTPVDQAPVDQAPADQAPADQAPADQAPADQTPTDQAPADQTPADQAPADQTQDQAPTEPSNTDASNTDASNTDASNTDASNTDASNTDPSNTDPSNTDPSTTDPSTTDPSTTDPSTTDPSTTDPSTTDPSNTDQGQTDASQRDDGTPAAAATGTTTTAASVLDGLGDMQIPDADVMGDQVLDDVRAETEAARQEAEQQAAEQAAREEAVQTAPGVDDISDAAGQVTDTAPPVDAAVPAADSDALAGDPVATDPLSADEQDATEDQDAAQTDEAAAAAVTAAAAAGLVATPGLIRGAGGPRGVTPPRAPFGARPTTDNPATSSQQAGQGWSSIPDPSASDPADAADPDYGKPRPAGAHGTFKAPYQQHPGLRNLKPEVRSLITDPSAGYGRDTNGTPLTPDQFQERYVDQNGDYVYPGERGGEPGSFRRIDDVATFRTHFGGQLDRMGGTGGDFFSIPGTPFEQRALPPSNLTQPYTVLDLHSLPPGAYLEVSRIAPAFGRPGGGLQVRVIGSGGKPISMGDLMSTAQGGPHLTPAAPASPTSAGSPAPAGSPTADGSASDGGSQDDAQPRSGDAAADPNADLNAEHDADTDTDTGAEPDAGTEDGAQGQGEAQQDAEAETPQQIRDRIDEALTQSNTRHDPFDLSNGYATNCGNVAANMNDFLNGEPMVDAGTGTLDIDQMEQRTSLPQTETTPDQIEATLRAQGPGSHMVIGIDRSGGRPGHWFNAVFDGEQVWTVDGQDGTRSPWPPHEPHAERWDASVDPSDLVDVDADGDGTGSDERGSAERRERAGRDYPGAGTVDDPKVVDDWNAPETPFASRTHEPDTVYQVEGRGIFHTGADGRVTRVETSYGATGLNYELHRPQPDTTYVVATAGGTATHTFQTDSSGRVTRATTDNLTRERARRSDAVQRSVAALGGSDYNGGHLFGNQFGGGGESLNLIPMLESVNQNRGPHSFYRLEGLWSSLVRAGVTVTVDIRVTQFDSAGVPAQFTVRWSADGVKYDRKFRNV